MLLLATSFGELKTDWSDSEGDDKVDSSADGDSEGDIPASKQARGTGLNQGKQNQQRKQSKPAGKQTKRKPPKDPTGEARLGQIADMYCQQTWLTFRRVTCWALWLPSIGQPQTKVRVRVTELEFVGL